MALILDTNALSAFVDGNEGLRLAIDHETDLALPAVVLGEYLFGVRQSRHRARYESWLRIHSGLFLFLSIGRETAAHYAEIRTALKSSGQPIPNNDLWIAALAKEHSFRILSRDRHFAVISGLTLVSW